MSKKRGLIFLVSILALLFSVSLVSAQSEGIPLQKDVLLGAPIYGPEDLPEEVTFTLYDAQNGLTPLGSQTFTRGQYTVDFEFSQSDGVTGGNVARVKAEFTNTLNLKDDFGEPVKPKELWAALEVAGAEMGPRSKVSDETLVRLLLNSDASLATYLTLAYEGDDNPLTTIYKDLPISTLSSDGSTTSLSGYFSSLAGDSIAGNSREFGDTVSGHLFVRNGNIYVDNGYELIWYDSAGVKRSFLEFTGSDNILIGPTSSPIGTNSSMIFSAGSGEVMRIRENGNVFIPSGHFYMSNGYQLVWYDSAGSPRTFLQFDASDNIIIGPTSSPIGTNSSMIFSAGFGEVMRIRENGNVGIGTTNIGAYKLAVGGKIRSEEIQVDTGWADFVFEPGYKLPTLDEVELYIKDNRHLPGIPTEAEVKTNGIGLGNISAKLLQKIEELTLYVIDIKKENESLKTQLVNMQVQLNEIRK